MEEKKRVVQVLTTWRQSADSLTLSRSPNFLCALNRVVKSKETFLYFFVISLVSFSFFKCTETSPGDRVDFFLVFFSSLVGIQERFTST